ncbi:hypothetical protein CK936_17395, partial [Streptomyces albireticuli]
PLAAAVALAVLGVGPVTGAAAEGADDPALDAADAKKVDEFLERAKETEQTVSPELKAVALISRTTQCTGHNNHTNNPTDTNGANPTNNPTRRTARRPGAPSGPPSRTPRRPLRRR